MTALELVQGFLLAAARPTFALRATLGNLRLRPPSRYALRRDLVSVSEPSRHSFACDRAIGETSLFTRKWRNWFRPVFKNLDFEVSPTRRGGSSTPI
jgi:hypothetical protein